MLYCFFHIQKVFENKNFNYTLKLRYAYLFFSCADTTKSTQTPFYCALIISMQYTLVVCLPIFDELAKACTYSWRVDECQAKSVFIILAFDAFLVCLIKHFLC